MTHFDATFLLGIGVGFTLRHFLPIVVGYLAVQLKRVRWHGQAT